MTWRRLTLTMIGILATFGILATIGCVEGTSYVTPGKSEKASKFLLDKPPAGMTARVNANLEDKVVLLGYDVSKDSVEPGDRVEVTWYWQCKAETGPGWRLFTHVLDASGKSRINRDKVGDLRESFQPEHWKPGMIFKDPQVLRIPDGWKSDVFELKVGLWKGDGRMHGKGPAVDDRHRIQGPKIKIKRTKKMVAKIPRATAAPVIDGEFEADKAWADALKLGAFSHTMTGEPSARPTQVRLMWDDENLYVAMQAKDDFLKSEYTEHDDTLWKADAFEVFLDPRGDKKDYYELQVSPAGVVFDSHLATYRKNRNEWTSQMVAKVSTQGKVNDESDEDKGWTAELAIPFASFDRGGGVPPKPNDKWRANFFRVDITKTKPKYSAWSPPLRGDFHALDKFGELVFWTPELAESAKKDKKETPKAKETTADGAGKTEKPVAKDESKK